MRTPLVLITLTILICSCGGTGQEKVKTADTLNTTLANDNYLDTKTKTDTDTSNKTAFGDTLPNISLGKMALVSSGQMSPYKSIKIGGFDFDLVMSNNDTTYLATNDNKFQTPEGYKVGTKFSDLPKDIQDHLTKEPGWGFYYKLASGWILGFCEGSSCTDMVPTNSSKVKWIFKRQ